MLKLISRIVLYFASASIAVFICIQLSFTFYFNNSIKSELQEQVSIQSNGEYQLKIDKLNTNIFNQSVFLSGFFLNSVKEKNVNAAKYIASAREINLIDFKLWPFLFNKDLIVDRMELLSPSGYIIRSTEEYYTSTKDTSKKFSLYNLLSGHLHSLTIKKIEIINSDIKVYDNAKDTLPSISSGDNSVEILNFIVNETAEKAGRLFLADQVDLEIRNFSYTAKDSLYSISIKKLVASYTDSVLTLDQIKVIPNFSKKEFASEAGKQTDRMKISIQSASYNKMNVKLFFERNWFIARQLKIDSLSISAYRDKNDSGTHERKKSLQQLIRSIPAYTSIDSIQLEHSIVTYEEVGIGSTKPGKISFDNLNASITGFTNDTSIFSRIVALKINASCNFMNKGKLTALYGFPLNTDKMVFDCSGKLTDMPLPAINPMLKPNTNVLIKDGVIDSMIFSFHANEIESRGSMKLIYRKLQIELLDKRNKKESTLKNLLSFLAHRLIIKEENPSPKEPVRITEINYPWDGYHFIFNYSWKSILSGIKPAIGLPTVKAKMKLK